MLHSHLHRLCKSVIRISPSILGLSAMHAYSLLAVADMCLHLEVQLTAGHRHQWLYP
jgi:hypothetical protein